MICDRPACGGNLRIYRTVELKILNLRHHYAICSKCRKKYLLETKIKRKVRVPKNTNR